MGQKVEQTGRQRLVNYFPEKKLAKHTSVQCLVLDFIAISVINQSQISSVFSIVRFPGCTKTVLSGESLYIVVVVVVHVQSYYGGKIVV